ncbi:NAD binding domain of 6-phosphogluconate dehydrogenase family protein, partial [Vibrio parahaemolyticus VPTS-2010]
RARHREKRQKVAISYLLVLVMITTYAAWCMVKKAC